MPSAPFAITTHPHTLSLLSPLCVYLFVSLFSLPKLQHSSLLNDICVSGDLGGHHHHYKVIAVTTTVTIFASLPGP